LPYPSSTFGIHRFLLGKDEKPPVYRLGNRAVSIDRLCGFVREIKAAKKRDLDGCVMHSSLPIDVDFALCMCVFAGWGSAFCPSLHI